MKSHLNCVYCKNELNYSQKDSVIHYKVPGGIRGCGPPHTYYYCSQNCLDNFKKTEQCQICLCTNYAKELIDGFAVCTDDSSLMEKPTCKHKYTSVFTCNFCDKEKKGVSYVVNNDELFDITELDATNFDLTNYDSTKFDLTKYDSTKFDLTKCDSTKFDLTNSDIVDSGIEYEPILLLCENCFSQFNMYDNCFSQFNNNKFDNRHIYKTHYENILSVGYDYPTRKIILRLYKDKLLNMIKSAKIAELTNAKTDEEIAELTDELTDAKTDELTDAKTDEETIKQQINKLYKDRKIGELQTLSNFIRNVLNSLS